MEYLNSPISDDYNCYYCRNNTDKYNSIKIISDGYVMLNVDYLSIIPISWYESFKTELKFILRSGELEFLYDIDPCIINNMTHLVLMNGCSYDYLKYLDNLKSLKYLEICNDCDDFNLIKLPPNLEALLILDYWRITSLNDILPLTLKYLNISGGETIIEQNLDLLPSKLEILIIKIIKYNLPLDNLPPNLKILVIRSQKINKSLCNLPSNLEFLGLCSYSYHHAFEYSQNITNLPHNIKYCVLDPSIYYKFNKSILETNPNCIVSDNVENCYIKNIRKLFI